MERELGAHSVHLEALQEMTEQDATTINQLTTSKEELEAEMKEREKNIKYLENLIQEVTYKHTYLQTHIHTNTHTCCTTTRFGHVALR